MAAMVVLVAPRIPLESEQDEGSRQKKGRKPDLRGQGTGKGKTKKSMVR